MSRLWTGHVDHLDLDLLVTEWENGTLEAAVRPGRDQRRITWSPPVPLTPEPTEVQT